jgi:hypothetical protein
MEPRERFKSEPGSPIVRISLKSSKVWDLIISLIPAKAGTQLHPSTFVRFTRISAFAGMSQ